VLSDRGLCDGLITCTEESYRLWRAVVCDQGTSRMRRLKPATGLWKIQSKGCNAKKTNTNKQQPSFTMQQSDLQPTPMRKAIYDHSTLFCVYGHITLHSLLIQKRALKYV